MSDDAVRDALGVLGRPVDPPREFAEPLLRRLIEELEEGRRSTPPHMPRRPRRAGFALAAATIAIAVAVVAAVLLTLRSSPASADALLRRAERQFAAAPPFRAVVVGREVVTVNRIRRDWAYTDVVLYGGRNRWRRNVLRDSLSPNSPFYSMTGTGSFFVWDGHYLGISRADRRFELSPGLSGTDGHDDSGFVFAELSPISPFPPRGSVSLRYLTQDCARVFSDTTIVGRRAHHLGCGPRASHFELWLDSETGFVLKRVGPHGAMMEVRSIDYDPVFPKGAFRVVPPPGATIVWEGPGAPPRTFPPTKGG
jgi:hypothetical protein